MTARFDSMLARTGSLRAVALLRIAAGPLVLFHLRPFFAAATEGRVPGDTFVVPFADWYPMLPRDLYQILLWATIPAALLLSIGLFTRVAAGYSAGFVVYNLFLSQTHFHHNRAFLSILLVGLAALKCGDHISIDALRRGGPPQPAPLWPLWLMRFEVAVIYTASGFSKLIDGDWFGGTVLRLRIEQWRGVALDRGVPGWFLDLLSDPGFMSAFSKVVVVTELFIGIALITRRFRTAAIWVAIPFHLAIEMTASVQVFSWAALAALVIWVSPIDHDRVLTVPPRSRLRAVVGWLDWTGRFRLIDGPLRLEDRGHVLIGRDAVWAVLSRLPLTFPVAGPVRLARSLRPTDGESLSRIGGPSG